MHRGALSSRRPTTVALAPSAAAVARQDELSPPGPAPASTSGGWLAPLGVVMIGMFMAILDTSIVNIAIPTIDNQLGASPDLGEWVATGYNLALGVVVPTSGWLGDRFGLERVQTVALILFVIGSALCGLSSSITVMIAFRLFQAIGGGLLPAVSLTIVYRLVPPEKIGVAMGIFGFGTVFAPAIGPALGGFLVQYSSWRLIYFINIPIGIVGAALSYRLLPRFARAPGRRFDLAGWVTIAVSLFSLLLALSEGEKWNWTSYRVLVLLAVGVLSLALFVVIELSAERPLLDLGIFKSFNFTISAVLVALLSNGLFSGQYFVPLFLQQGDGLGAFQTGLTLVPPVLVLIVLMPVSGELFDRLGARWLGAIGLLIIAVATYLMHGISPEVSRGQVMMWLALQYLGVGLAFIPIQTGSMSRLSPDELSGGSAINNIVQRVSGALGTAVLGALLTGYQAQRLAGQADLLPAVAPGVPQLQALADQGQAGGLFLLNEVQLIGFGRALGDVFLLTAALTAFGALLALLLPRKQARSAGGRVTVALE